MIKNKTPNGITLSHFLSLQGYTVFTRSNKYIIITL